MYFNKIFVKNILIVHESTDSVYCVERAIKIMVENYAGQWNKSMVSLLFNLRCDSAEDFTKLEKIFLEAEMVSAVQEFRDNFYVEKKHEDQKKTIDVCLDFYENFKALYVFSSGCSLDNKNRDSILAELADFFDKYTLDSSTKNERFLNETLTKLRKLPVDCIALDASVSLEYVVAQLCSLADLQSDDEFRRFLSLFNNCCVVNVNHNFLLVKRLIFCQPPSQQQQ